MPKNLSTKQCEALVGAVVTFDRSWLVSDSAKNHVDGKPNTYPAHGVALEYLKTTNLAASKFAVAVAETGERIDTSMHLAKAWKRVLRSNFESLPLQHICNANPTSPGAKGRSFPLFQPCLFAYGTFVPLIIWHVLVFWTIYTHSTTNSAAEYSCGWPNWGVCQKKFEFCCVVIEHGAVECKNRPWRGFRRVPDIAWWRRRRGGKKKKRHRHSRGHQSTYYCAGNSRGRESFPTN